MACISIHLHPKNTIRPLAINELGTPCRGREVATLDSLLHYPLARADEDLFSPHVPFDLAR